MRSEPLISVVVPVRDGASFLASALNSIVAQRYPNLEVLLVDDGSADDLPERARDCPPFVRYFRQPPLGQSAARNCGIRESKGDLIAFLDIDDLWADGHLTTMTCALVENREAGIAQGTMRQFWAGTEGKYHRTEPYRMPYLGSCLFRAGVFRQCGPFDETMPYGEDYDFLFRCWENDVFKVHAGTLSLLYRRHAQNMSRGKNNAAHLLVLKRRIGRIRAGLTDPVAARRYAFEHYIGERQPGELSSTEVSEWELRSA